MNRGQGRARAGNKVGEPLLALSFPVLFPPPAPVPGFVGRSHHLNPCHSPPIPSFFPRLARPGPELSSGLTDRAKPISLKQLSNSPSPPLCVPTPLCAHHTLSVPAKAIQRPHPNNRVSDKTEAESILYWCWDPWPHHPPWPTVYPPFLPRPHPGVCGPAAGPPCWGLSEAAANPDVQAARTSVWQTRSRGLFPVGQNRRDKAVGDSGGLSGVWAGWGGRYLKDSPVTHDPECGGRRWRAAAAWSPKPTVHSSIK